MVTKYFLGFISTNDVIYGIFSFVVEREPGFIKQFLGVHNNLLVSKFDLFSHTLIPPLLPAICVAIVGIRLCGHWAIVGITCRNGSDDREC